MRHFILYKFILITLFFSCKSDKSQNLDVENKIDFKEQLIPLAKNMLKNKWQVKVYLNDFFTEERYLDLKDTTMLFPLFENLAFFKDDFIITFDSANKENWTHKNPEAEVKRMTFTKTPGNKLVQFSILRLTNQRYGHIKEVLKMSIEKGLTYERLEKLPMKKATSKLINIEPAKQ